MHDLLEILPLRLAAALKAHHKQLAVAESCTGGWIAKALTDIAGSSSWFERGFVTYSNDAKQEMLGVEEDILNSFGAVSEEVVLAMARGALEHSKADISVAVSGIAGPGGGTAQKPVGTVWLAWDQGEEGGAVVRLHHFKGDRESVRQQSVVAALVGVLELLPDKS